MFAWVTVIFSPDVSLYMFDEKEWGFVRLKCDTNFDWEGQVKQKSGVHCKLDILFKNSNGM